MDRVLIERILDAQTWTEFEFTEYELQKAARELRAIADQLDAKVQRNKAERKWRGIDG